MIISEVIDTWAYFFTFFLQAVLIVYVGANFYVFTDLAELEIPTNYDELDKILKVARIILQIK
ncbi:16325_t:CDS:1, partial [Funneliformis geosporum]